MSELTLVFFNRNGHQSSSETTREIRRLEGEFLFLIAFLNRFSRNRRKRSRSASTGKAKYIPDNWCIIFTANSPGNRQEIYTSVQHN